MSAATTCPDEPTWKDAHDALSQYVTTLMVANTPEQTRDAAFARYTAVYTALTDGTRMAEDEHGLPITCAAFVDDGRTRKCARCGWWRTTHSGRSEP